MSSSIAGPGLRGIVPCETQHSFDGDTAGMGGRVEVALHALHCAVA